MGKRAFLLSKWHTWKNLTSLNRALTSSLSITFVMSYNVGCGPGVIADLANAHVAEWEPIPATSFQNLSVSLSTRVETERSSRLMPMLLVLLMNWLIFALHHIVPSQHGLKLSLWSNQSACWTPTLYTAPMLELVKLQQTMSVIFKSTYLRTMGADILTSAYANDRRSHDLCSRSSSSS